jgi:hypothetical protein
MNFGPRHRAPSRALIGLLLVKHPRPHHIAACLAGRSALNAHLRCLLSSLLVPSRTLAAVPVAAASRSRADKQGPWRVYCVPQGRFQLLKGNVSVFNLTKVILALPTRPT